MTTFTEPLLGAELERELARRIEAGVAAQAWLQGRWLSTVALTRVEAERLVAEGRAAQDRFVRANLKLVARIAYAEATRLGLSRDDLFQEGTLGLLEAVRRWDRCRGLRFTTYAVPWIRSYVAAVSATRNGELHLTPAAGRTLHRVRAAAARAQIRGRVCVTQVAADVALSERATRRWLDYAAPSTLNEEWDEHVGSGEEPIDDELDVAALVAELPPLERQIVEWRFGLGSPDGQRCTQLECARRLGLSERQVRRAEVAALALLRDALPAANAA